MNYQKLFSKSWDLIWKNKFLIVLGMLVVLSGIGGGGGSRAVTGGNGNYTFQNPPRYDYNFTDPLGGLSLPIFAAGSFLILALLAIVLVLWIVGTISRGGLIFGADKVSRERTTNFAESIGAGWQRVWRLVGISLVPAIPVLLLTLTAFISFGMYRRSGIILQEGSTANTPNALIFIPILAVTAFLVLLTLGLSLLRTFANRACMLEDMGVFAAYRRGFEVLTHNLVPAGLLFVLQILVSIGIWALLLVPGILVSLCCLLWPILLLVQGTFAAFYSTLWTLAWNQWANNPETTEANPIDSGLIVEPENIAS